MTGYVLVVEDEQAIGEMIKMSLEKNGHRAKLAQDANEAKEIVANESIDLALVCLLYTSPSPRDATLSRMPSSA